MIGNMQKGTVDGRRIWRMVIAGLIMLMALSAAAFAQSRPKVTVSADVEPRQPVLLVVDGKIIEAEAAEWKRGDQLMVWLRDLEGLGWGKASAGEGGAAIFQGNGVTLSFTKNQDVAKVNSLAITLPISTYLKDGKLMVPLSFVAKSLGYDFDRSYKFVVTVNTKPIKPEDRPANTICGKVFYCGKGIGGITVRAVDRELRIVKGALSKTAADGTYRITGLPNGEFMAYVYVGDNAGYFNRMSETAAVKNGETMQLKTMPISRIISPVSPQPEAKVTPSAGKIAFGWTPCPLAASYQFAVKRKGADSPDYWVKCKTASYQMPANKLKPGVVYEVAIAALDASGISIGGTAGAGGKPWSFSIAAAPVRSGR